MSGNAISGGRTLDREEYLYRGDAFLKLIREKYSTIASVEFKQSPLRYVLSGNPFVMPTPLGDKTTFNDIDVCMGILGDVYREPRGEIFERTKDLLIKSLPFTPEEVRTQIPDQIQVKYNGVVYDFSLCRNPHAGALFKSYNGLMGLVGGLFKSRDFQLNMDGLSFLVKKENTPTKEIVVSERYSEIITYAGLPRTPFKDYLRYGHAQPPDCFATAKGAYTWLYKSNLIDSEYLLDRWGNSTHPLTQGFVEFLKTRKTTKVGLTKEELIRLISNNSYSFRDKLTREGVA